jgi:hypothetical protein
MARTMKTVHAPSPQGDTLVIVLDPLQVARGPRLLPRGGRHGCGKHPGRARAKRQWRRQLEGGGRMRA